MENIEAGTKIQYRLFDKENKEHWFDGVVHGVRRYENPKTGVITKITYLVDTGRDERVDEQVYDQRDRAISEHVTKLTRKGADILDALAQVHKRDDLPQSKVITERIRQPEQIELPAEHIRLV